MTAGVRRKDVVINISISSFNYTTPSSDVRDAVTRLFRTVLKSKATVAQKWTASVFKSALMHAICTL